MTYTDLPRAVPFFGPPADPRNAWLRVGGTEEHCAAHPGAGFIHVAFPASASRVTPFTDAWKRECPPHNLLQLSDMLSSAGAVEYWYRRTATELSGQPEPVTGPLRLVAPKLAVDMGLPIKPGSNNDGLSRYE